MRDIQRTILRVQSWLPAGSTLHLPGEFTAPENSIHGDSGSIRVGVLRISPVDWLLVSDTLPPGPLCVAAGLERGKNGVAIVDLTHALSVIEFTGEHARDVLSKGCGVDLHPSRFSVGQHVCTRLARIAAVIACTASPVGFEIYVPRSYSNYLQEWLRDALVEFTVCHDLQSRGINGVTRGMQYG